MKRHLPPRPNLDQLKNQAKDLLKAHKAGDADALKRIRDQHPRWARAGDAELRKARFTLSGAQLVVAREYGFAGWPALKKHVEALAPADVDVVEAFKKAFTSDDAATVRRLLKQNPDLKARINDPVAAFDSPLVTRVKSRAMLDALLDAGANLDAKSTWWAGGFGLLHQASPELSAYAIERGAQVDVHAAARLGLMDKLREMVAANPELVHARGGDGQTPLHFASTVEVAEFLLDHGADIDARDVDHESTPAQYMLDDRQEIARFLIRRGCKTDLLMAAALGDLDLIRRHLDEDPACIRMRVSPEYFPMIQGKAGGTIYQWTLGFYLSAHQVARKFGHDDAFHLLRERSPADVRFILSCWLMDEADVQALRKAHPNLVQQLAEEDRRQVAHAARNNETGVVRIMLEAGLPVDTVGQHRGTPLHWAAYHGNAEMAQTILRFAPPLEVLDGDFQGTPLGWAIHGSEQGWYCKTGDYANTVEALLRAGTKPPEFVEGSPAVREVLRKHGVKEKEE